MALVHDELLSQLAAESFIGSFLFILRNIPTTVKPTDSPILYMLAFASEIDAFYGYESSLI